MLPYIQAIADFIDEALFNKPRFNPKDGDAKEHTKWLKITHNSNRGMVTNVVVAIASMKEIGARAAVMNKVDGAFTRNPAKPAGTVAVNRVVMVARVVMAIRAIMAARVVRAGAMAASKGTTATKVLAMAGKAALGNRAAKVADMGSRAATAAKVATSHISKAITASRAGRAAGMVAPAGRAERLRPARQ
ncbi:MAG: hypothetical protein U1F68_04945 [Gammaproteobacteria bacterium]